MNSPQTQPPLVRFGPFTANLHTGELWKDGIRIKLQIQPFQILTMLLERPNELVAREDLQRKLWPSDTFVDFDQGLNKAVNKLRDALCDSADAPRFIETVPRRGYRFIAPVVVDPRPTESPEKLTAAPAIPTTAAHPTSSLSKTRRAAVVLALAVVLIAILAFVWRSRTVSSETLHSVAVLPLTSQGAAGDYDVADGMTDSIINNLSFVPNLRVTSHASVFQYRGQVVDPRAAGRKLDVSAVLTGRVVQAGTSMSVNLELTATADGRHLWGQQYTRNLTDRAALQQEVAGAVADALQLSLTPARRQQMSRLTTSDAEAQQLYNEARYYFFNENHEDVLLARKLFEEAIHRDPTFALAYGGLGDTYDWMATEGFQPLDEVVGQSIQAKSKANELNDSLAEIHSSIGGLELAQWNWSKAESEFQKALQINPNYFEAHRLYSIYLRTMRRFPEAIQHAKKCDQLNPLLMPAKSHLALTYYYAGQFDAAAEQYRLILKDHPEAASAHAGLSNVFLKMGREKDAVEEWQRALALEGDDAAAQNVGSTYQREGLRAARARLIRAEMQSLNRLARDNHYVSPVEFAYRYALLGDKENAFLWLEKAYAERSPQLFNLNVDPDYDNLRSDPRFTDLVARLHLPQ
jgi:DNA-binding winged helix-turn-helix (wHTH) protein/TolB-like protein/Tfp pilus assembly protein PilF